MTRDKRNMLPAHGLGFPARWAGFFADLSNRVRSGLDDQAGDAEGLFQ
ncbi:hypothetical protein [Bradyrhizobium sp. WD16]|nr:hypothetical protein [Bradyrhizobium sp. WD16]